MTLLFVALYIERATKYKLTKLLKDFNCIH